MNAQTNGAAIAAPGGAATVTVTPPPDPNGGGRMSGRAWWLSLSIGLLAIGVLSYALDSNRPPAPAVAAGEGGNAQQQLNWPSAHDESVHPATPPLAAAAPAPSAAAPAQFSQFPTQGAGQGVMPRAPDPLSEWRRRSYLTALQAPIEVGSAHAGSTLELPGARGGLTPAAAQPDPQGAYGPNGGAQAQYHPPAPPFTVMAGSVIPATLITGITSDAPAQALAQVAENVYDSATGRYLLIPQGSRVIGDYSTSVRYGQQRIAISWRRLILPDTASIDLPSVPATDAAGYGGLADQVNNHYLKQFGTAAVISLIDAGQMVGQMGMYGGSYGFGMPYGAGGYNMSSTEMMGLMGGSAVGQQLGQTAQSSLQQGMNIPPTINIRPGYILNIELTTDVTLPGPFGAYRP